LVLGNFLDDSGWGVSRMSQKKKQKKMGRVCSAKQTKKVRVE